MQHGENNHHGHRQNYDGITQRFFDFVSKLFLGILLTCQLKAAFIEFSGKFPGTDHRLIEWRKDLRPLRQRGRKRGALLQVMGQRLQQRLPLSTGMLPGKQRQSFGKRKPRFEKRRQCAALTLKRFARIGMMC